MKFKKGQEVTVEVHAAGLVTTESWCCASCQQTGRVARQRTRQRPQWPVRPKYGLATLRLRTRQPEDRVNERRDCECGEFIVTNDPYMLDAWKEWHEDGAFLAGKYHKPVISSAPKPQNPMKAEPSE